MKKAGILLMMACLAIGIAIAGCSGGADPTEGGKYTFAEYCDQMAEQTKKAAKGAPIEESALKEVKDKCMATNDEIKKQIDNEKKQVKAEAAFVKFLMEKCDGKEGSEWLTCNISNAQGAQDAANDAI